MTMQSTPTTGMTLKLERVRRDIKLKDLAARIGVHPTWVTRVEQSRTVPADRAQRYSDGLATFPTVVDGSEAQ